MVSVDRCCLVFFFFKTQEELLSKLLYSILLVLFRLVDNVNVLKRNDNNVNMNDANQM